MLEPHEYYPGFSVLSLTDGADWRRLSILLASPSPTVDLPKLLTASDLEINRLTDYESLLEDRHRLPQFYLMDLLNPEHPSTIGALSCVIEADYCDREYSPTFSRLYSRTLRDRPRRSVRLHFFSSLDIDYSCFLLGDTYNRHT